MRPQAPEAQLGLEEGAFASEGEGALAPAQIMAVRHVLQNHMDRPFRKLELGEPGHCNSTVDSR